MRLSSLICCMVVGLLLVLPSECQADLIPWMYNWSRDPHQIQADAPGTGYITLTDEALRTAVGESDIVATNLRTFSTATGSAPDTFTAKPYSLTLFIRDLESGNSGTLTFTGVIDGTLTEFSSNLRNTFTGPVVQTITLGNHTYTAMIGPYAPPGPPGSVNSGSVSGHTSISITPIVTIPEPTSLTLTGLGLTFIALRLAGVRRHDRSPHSKRFCRKQDEV